MLKKILSSNIVWKLSGLTFRTAVIATHGYYVSIPKYLSETKSQMRNIEDYFGKDTSVMEFGCGLGGNLLAVSDLVKNGVGLDINSLYIRQANRLKSKYKVENVQFKSYDGANIQFRDNEFDLIFSLGVFERINKITSRYLLSQLSHKIKADGKLILYFLNPRARGTPFVNKLGENSYAYWCKTEIEKLALENSLKIEDIIEWKSGFSNEIKSVADVYVFNKF